MIFSKWSKRMGLILIPTLLMCLVTTSCTSFFQLLLYPLARAGGGPEESELKVFRENFSRMQRDLPSSKLVVFPSCLVNFEKHEWKPETAELMIDLFRDEQGIKPYAVKTHPDVAFLPLYRNQMRYMWDRHRAYAHGSGMLIRFRRVNTPCSRISSARRIQIAAVSEAYMFTSQIQRVISATQP